MNRRALPGYLAATTVAVAALLPQAILAGYAGGSIDPLALLGDAYLLRVLRFSLWQAALSTLCSVLPAIWLARALARRPALPGRRLLLALFGLPLVIPSIVAVLGIVSIFGADGWLPLGRSLYGLGGILIAHVFFNLPLATRLLLPTLEQIPANQWRLARQLGFGATAAWRHLEWPALRGALPGVALLVFMLCLTSFAVVLTLGGGPRSTTLEVAIYQSLRFDFDPPRAVALALLQLSLCAALAATAAHFTRPAASEISVDDDRSRGLGDSPGRRLLDALAIGIGALLTASVVIAVLADGFRGPVAAVLGDPRTWRSAGLSAAVALSTTLLAVIAAWLIARAAALEAASGRQARGHLLETAGSLVYVVPPLVIGTGLFLALSGRVDLDAATLPAVIAVNTLMGVPFALRSIAAPLRRRIAEYDRLCRSLDVAGLDRFRLIEFPLLRGPLGLAAALVAAMSFGDLGVVALFAGDDIVTLPLLLYQRLSAYRVGEAAVTALLLLSLCLLLFIALERAVGGRRAAR